MRRLNSQLSILALFVLGSGFSLTGCSPPNETIPSLKPREKPPINIVSEWNVPGYSGSGWTTSGMSGSGLTWTGSGVTWTGSGVTWAGSGVTWQGSGVTWTGSGITVGGSGITVPRTGILLRPSGVTAPSSGVTLPSSGIRLPSRGIQLRGSGVTAPSGIRVPQSNLLSSRLIMPVAFQAKAAEEAKVAVKLADHEEFKQAVAKQAGKVVVVDVWSTSCVPCMKEFPNLVQLAKSRPDKVACVSLNVDYIGLKRKPPESYLPKVQGFLEKQGAAFTNFVSKEADEAMRAKLDISSIPAILIYDQSGELAHRVTVDNSGEELTYEGDVVPKVEALLK